jgi:hypothetical protein
LRGLLLTGEADRDELGAAIREFHDYLPKSDVLQLPARVFEQYVAYIATNTSHHQNTDSRLIYQYKQGFWRFTYRILYKLAFVEVLDQEYVSEDSWLGSVQILAGRQETITESIMIGGKMVVERESEETLKSVLSIKKEHLIGLQAGLEDAVKNRLKVSEDILHERTKTVQQTYQLPAEPSDPDKVYVKARVYQWAPVCQRLLLGLVKSCECCNSEQTLSVRIQQPTDLIATRQQDYLSDGTRRVTFTGNIRIPAML